MSLDTFSLLLAAEAPQQLARNQQGELIKMIAMFAIFGIMMWVLMIRPQQKKAREHDAMIKTLKAGDKVITTSGIIGVVLSVKDKSVSIRSADTKIEILKSAVSAIDRSGESTES